MALQHHKRPYMFHPISQHSRRLRIKQYQCWFGWTWIIPQPWKVDCLMLATCCNTHIRSIYWDYGHKAEVSFNYSSKAKKCQIYKIDTAVSVDFLSLKNMRHMAKVNKNVIGTVLLLEWLSQQCAVCQQYSVRVCDKRNSIWRIFKQPPLKSVTFVYKCTIERFIQYQNTEKKHTTLFLLTCN